MESVKGLSVHVLKPPISSYVPLAWYPSETTGGMLQQASLWPWDAGMVVMVGGWLWKKRSLAMVCWWFLGAWIAVLLACTGGLVSSGAAGVVEVRGIWDTAEWEARGDARRGVYDRIDEAGGVYTYEYTL